MTGAGDDPRDLRDFIVDARKRVVALERRQGTSPARLQGSAGIAVVTDCNAAIEAGWYLADSAANAPVGTGAGSIFVLRGLTSTAGVRQEFRRIYTDSGVQDTRRWVRTSINTGSSWTPWVLIEGSSNSGNWTDLSSFMLAGYTVTYFEGRRTGPLVELRFQIAVTTAIAASTGLTDLTSAIPAEWRPVRNAFAAAYGSGYPFVCIVRPTGIIGVNNRTAIAAGVSIYLTAVYHED